MPYFTNLVIIIGFLIIFKSVASFKNEVNFVPPVIDISSLINLESHDWFNNNIDLINQIYSACETWGFFYISNHGIDLRLQNDLKNEMFHFFKANYEVKDKIRRTINNSRGFADDELTKQQIDRKQIFDMGHVPFAELNDNNIQNHVIDGYNQWPEGEEWTSFQNVIKNYYSRVSELAYKLIHVISLSLTRDDLTKFNVIRDSFANHTSLFRLNYYPVETAYIELNVDGSEISNANYLGVSRHTDAGGLTLVLQDQIGLEVYTGTKEDKNDGEWVPVSPVDGTLTVNIGDMLQVWSNKRFKAAEHRVIASKSIERYSAAFFFNPSYDTIVRPLEFGLASIEQGVYNEIEWGYFRRQRFLGDYADFGKEIQIEDYLAV